MPWRARAAMECSITRVPGFSTVNPSSAASCRVQRLQADGYDACAAACLAQPFCDAFTFFGMNHSDSAARGICLARTAGTEQVLRQEEGATSGFRACYDPSCALQRRLDDHCAAIGERSHVARNFRVLHRPVDDYKFACSPAPDASAMLALACVDDRGHPLPCRTHSIASMRRLGSHFRDHRSTAAELHDMHRQGCGPPPRCLTSPGLGWTSRNDAACPSRQRSLLGEGSDTARWRRRSGAQTEEGREEVVNRLQRIGYLQCVADGDELKDTCTRNRPAFDWLNYTWGRDKQSTSEMQKVRAEVHGISWWLSQRDAPADAFDALGFVNSLLSLHKRRLEGPRSIPHVVFVGDSTARQQTTSLCCLLQAGLSIAGGTYAAKVTRNNPKMDYACAIYSSTPDPLVSSVREMNVHVHSRASPIATIRFERSNRADALPVHRPSQRAPELNSVLRRVIASTPTVLIINLGAWEFEDGCKDMHSLHDSYCNGTRPNILFECACGSELQITWHLT